MWARELSKSIGKTVRVQFEKITVDCQVKDIRKVWNRIDILVEPIDGDGRQWVSYARVRVPAAEGGHWLALAV